MESLPEINQKECLDFLSELIQIPSHTRTPAEIDAIKYMTKAQKAVGIEAESIGFKDKSDGLQRYNSVGVWKGTGKKEGKKLLYNGHVDVNPVSEGWTVDPYAGNYDDKFIWGIGVSNMKSSDAAFMMAVKTLKDAGYKVSKDCTLSFVVGELQGGAGTKALIEDGILTKDTCDVFINGEPTDVQALTIHAGSLVFQVDVTGVTRHMSKREEATDAILASIDAIQRLTDLTFSNPRSEEHKSVCRTHVGVILGAGLGKDYCGVRPPQVADYMSFVGAARYAPGQDRDVVLKDMDRELKKTQARFPGMKYEIKVIERDCMAPFEVPKDSYIVKTLNKNYKAITGRDQPTGAIKPPCFYGSDAGYLYGRLGLEGIVCGSGGKYNTMPDERVDIEDYLLCCRLYMRMIVEVCGAYKD